jgi:hypothetical protein
MTNALRRNLLGQLARAACLAIVVAGCNLVVADTGGGGGGGGGGFTGDGDRISNAVELNTPNKILHNFDTTRNDPDPSIARLLPTNGTLYNGINLPDQHANYYHYLGQYQGVPDPPDSDDWGTLTLLNLGEGVAEDWGNVFLQCNFNTDLHPPKFGIGDLSKGDVGTRVHGGYFPPHSWHRNGLDMDVRYLRKDRLPIGLNLKTAPGDYDTLATADLLSCFFAYSNVTKILVDKRYLGIPNVDTIPEFVHDTNHFDHFHVQIRDPDGTNN